MLNAINAEWTIAVLSVWNALKMGTIKDIEWYSKKQEEVVATVGIPRPGVKKVFAVNIVVKRNKS